MRRPRITKETRCAKCDARIKEGAFIFSRFSSSFYCANATACEKRSRKSRKGATA